MHYIYIYIYIERENPVLPRCVQKVRGERTKFLYRSECSTNRRATWECERRRVLIGQCDVMYMLSKVNARIGRQCSDKL